MKVVINTRGGDGIFGVSREAILAMRKRGSEIAKREVLLGEVYPNGLVQQFEWNWYGTDFPRNDTDLIAVVEELGAAANGMFAKLKVVEIPDGVEFEVLAQRGREMIHEKHRTWS